MQVLKAPNMEPIPGYRLIEPLGKGGFGEVWKCEAPGGLHKAIKFVTNTGDFLHSNSSGAEQELRALQHVKAIRHPFLLSMDRVELHDGELMIVMELADRNLNDVLEQYRAAGKQGIPRAELLAYLLEAAEVLDLMNHEYGLQHLDIKPRNLFLVGRHIKVADFGLVNSLAEMSAGKANTAQLGSITPLYASPESFLGKISLYSDQYSLAVSYCELLTGALPFEGKNFRQMAMQHMQAEPNLSRLPEHDRPVVARALAKDSGLRLPTSTEFVRALEAAGPVLGMAPVVRNSPSAAGRDHLPTPHEINLNDTANAEASPTLARTGRRDVMGTTPLPCAVTGGAGAPIPTGTGALVGYKFLECLSRGQTGEVWKTLAPGGKKRLVRFVYGYDPRAEADGEGTLARLRSLKHPTLAEVEIILEDTGRLTLISDPGETTLAGCLKECQAKGLSGIPRDQLLECLRLTAEALDDLHQRTRLQHLGLNPRHVVLAGDLMWLADFGLVELIWLPAGIQPAALNTRYSAPELFENQISRACDQYSLALIYLEMLTGVHPFRNLNQRQMATPKLRGKPDLGMAPAPDRPILLKALAAEPDERLASCTELVEALEQAGPRARPSGRSVGAAPGPEAPTAPSAGIANSVPEAVRKIMGEALQAAGADHELRECKTFQYLLRPGKGIAHRCFARVIPGTLNMRLDGFCRQWQTRFTAMDEQSLVCSLTFSGNLWQRALGKLPGLDLTLRLHPSEDSVTSLTDISIELLAVNCTTPRSDQLLLEFGPELLCSLRHHLQVNIERREEERIPYDQPVEVVPCEDGQEVGTPILGQAKDISVEGVGLLLACRPPTPEVHVHFSLRGGAETVTLLARVARVEPRSDGRFLVGLCFVM
jgi:serine/threonine protein kinase